MGNGQAVFLLIVRVAEVTRRSGPCRATSRRNSAAISSAGEEFPLECPNCGGDIRLIAFKIFYQGETIPGLRTVGNLRLLRTSCPRVGAAPPEGSRVAHQPGDRCGSAIDRAILGNEAL